MCITDFIRVQTHPSNGYQNHCPLIRMTGTRKLNNNSFPTDSACCRFTRNPRTVQHSSGYTRRGEVCVPRTQLPAGHLAGVCVRCYGYGHRARAKDREKQADEAIPNSYHPVLPRALHPDSNAGGRRPIQLPVGDKHHGVFRTVAAI